ncbi:MAG TPA: fumarylacetoacetate hydrolase family protein [Patescibacteria group bacterium]|nr:fumarylacetoacetate hydrolase family protein [Patescibacteria group bacterium]
MNTGESAGFGLGTFSAPGSPSFAGLVLDDRVAKLEALAPRMPGFPRGAISVLSLLEDWDRNLAALRRAADSLREKQDKAGPDEAFVPLSQLQSHPPVSLPRQVFCAGANYRKHVIDLMVDQQMDRTKDLSLEERRIQATKFMDERAAHGAPFIFSKAPSAITGPYDPVILPRHARQPDWELELAVIIGKPARHVRRDNALDYVAGYTIVNDITNRDLIFRKDAGQLGADWISAKSCPTYLPMGPYLVPAAFVADPQSLQITLRLNGKVMQDESTADMIFPVARIIEFLSDSVQLWPGDLIATGSPSGNGTHYNRFLKAGDIMEGTITGLGTQRNECIDE